MNPKSWTNIYYFYLKPNFSSQEQYNNCRNISKHELTLWFIKSKENDEELFKERDIKGII